MIWFALWLRNYSTTEIRILPLNGGSAVFADAPGNKSDLLIDCGNSNSVEFISKPFLRAQGVDKLPCVALTHGDLRHVGGIELVQSLFRIERIAIGSARAHSSTYRHVLDQLQQNPKLGGIVNCGDKLGDWTVLHPRSEDRFSEADDNALVFLGVFDGVRVLLLSDLGRPGQEALLSRTNHLQADIIVSCLPEKGEPLCEGLLDAIQPKFIIITDSEFPASKRASVQLRERLENRGVPVVFTRDSRAVTISLRKQHWQIRTMSGQKFIGGD